MWVCFIERADLVWLYFLIWGKVMLHSTRSMLFKVPVAMASHNLIKPFFQSLSEGVVPIFMLHRIEDKERGIIGTSVQVIDQFLKKLKKSGYVPMGMEELCQQIRMPYGVLRNRFLFTMDDGYLDQIEKGIPVFQENDCPVSVAIITDFVSGRSWPWDAKIRYLFEETNEKELLLKISDEDARAFIFSDDESKFSAMRFVREHLKKIPEEQIDEYTRILESKLNVQLPESAPKNYLPCDWSDVVRLEGKGVNFIPHTKNHYILSSLSDERAKEEIHDSIKELRKHIVPLPLFVYPNGGQDDYHQSHLQMLRECGIELAFTTQNTYVVLNELERDSDAPLILPRLGMPIDSYIQDMMLSKVDYIADRFHAGRLKYLFEDVYGIRRTAALSVFNKIVKYRNLKKAKELDFSRINRVVFVCVGNICRSPFAEIIALSNNSNIAITSAGIEASGGDSPDPMANRIAKEFGYNMEHLCSTALINVELYDTDLVVVMEPNHLKRVRVIHGNVNFQDTLLGVWGDYPTLSINDPYGRSAARFRVIFSHIQLGVESFFESYMEIVAKRESG